MAFIQTLTPARLKSLATGFAGVHTLNAGLTMLYSLAQTIVFSRSLDQRLYSMTIVATAVGLYLLPLNQSVARANFVLLRERKVRGEQQGAPDAAAAFNLNQIILILIPLLVPLTLGVANGAEYAAFACYLFFTAYSNIWYFEIQMSMMAVERALDYERISFIRRVISYVTLVYLFATHDFLICNILFALQTAAFHIYVTQIMARGWGLFDWPRGLTGAGVKRHMARLWVSLQATGAEWLTLNGPYAIFVARFGVGPGVVTIDAVLKLLRIVVSVTRNLSEIALPRVSRALLVGDAKQGHLPAILALAGGGMAAATCGVAVVFWEHLSFGLLLGPNNVVPHGAGAPAALALMAGVGIATGGHIIGYSGDHRSIPVLLTTSIVSVVGFAGYVLIAHASIIQALWAAAISLAIISATAVGLLVSILRR
jgi:hypothetical protein